MNHDSAHEPHGDGLHEDLVKLASRRDALKIFGSAGATAILSTPGASPARAKTPTAEVSDETAGRYPGDGSNGPNVLDDSGIVRHDIRRNFGSSRTLARGVPLRVNLTVTDAPRTTSRFLGRGLPVALRPAREAVAARAARAGVHGRVRDEPLRGSTSNLARTSLSVDNVFGNDRAAHQLATVTGNVRRGFVATSPWGHDSAFC